MVLDVLERCHIQLPVLGTLWLVSNSIAANQVKETSLLRLTVECPIIFHSLLWKNPELWDTSRSVLDPRPASRDWGPFCLHSQRRLREHLEPSALPSIPINPNTGSPVRY